MNDRATEQEYLLLKEEQAKAVNRVRAGMEMGPIVIKKRSCLRCESLFKSIGFANRICPKCSDSSEMK